MTQMTEELTTTRASYRGLRATAVDVTQTQILRSQTKDSLFKAQQDLRSALISLRRWVAAPVIRVEGNIQSLHSKVSSSTPQELNRAQPELLLAVQEVQNQKQQGVGKDS